MIAILTPAYGRDYKSRSAVVADFKADKDFLLANVDDPYCGKPVNRSQLVESGRYTGVQIRYGSLRKQTMLQGELL